MLSTTNSILLVIAALLILPVGGNFVYAWIYKNVVSRFKK